MTADKPADYHAIFSEIAVEIRNIKDVGSVASYIPELRNVDPAKCGAHLTTIDNQNYGFGDYLEKFSIQSISKVLALALAYELEDEALWSRVGVEPSGTPFNSLVQLEYEKGIPRNPFINPGALVLCDILVSRLKNPKAEFLEFIRGFSGNAGIDYCPKVAASEKSMGFKNAALINLMKSYGNIRVVRAKKSKRINSIMQLCGFYGQAGEFSFNVGLPGKNGVGGGILAVHPGKFSIAVWSPRLNRRGNSYRGMKILEILTTRTRSSIF